MNIAIIGAGFTGLSTAWELQKQGHKVTIFEASDHAGGLASGFKSDDWDWTLEKHYHHIFDSDQDILNLAKEMGLQDLFFFQKVKTSIRKNGTQFQFDSPLTVLTAPFLSPIDKVRTAATVAFLKFSPYLTLFESITAENFLKQTMGENAWQELWKPLFEGKFGKHYHDINAGWFWARIHVRSEKLGYVRGGFQTLIDEMVCVLKSKGVKFYFSEPVKSVKQKNNVVFVQTNNSKKVLQYTKVLITGPGKIVEHLVDDLPKKFSHSLHQYHGIGAITLVVELASPFFKDGTYWLNVNEHQWPMLAIVEHTHFAPAEKYGNRHLLYIGKYLESNEKQFSMNEKQLLKLYLPYLKKIQPEIEKSVRNLWVFREHFAQPLVGLHHQQLVPKFETPLSNIFWASMQHVYPFDRGTNYAVKIGKEVGGRIINQGL